MVEEIINQKTISDETLNQKLNNVGYIVVPFLSNEEIEDLKSFFYEHHQSDIPGFYASTHSPDIAFRLKMNEKIKAVFQKHVDEWFNNCEALGGAFIVKTKDQPDKLPPHQDWNIVDESKYRSFNVWVPLVDLSEENGAIRVLPKSHLRGESYRGPKIPDANQDKLDKYWDEMTTLNMKAGEALIYDHSLYHASYPNQTDNFRLATVFGVKPSEAKMYYYYGAPDGIDMYESSVDFYLTGDIQNGPASLTKVKRVKNYEQHPPEKALEKPSSFWEKVKSFFS
jgi:hypothetical protein